MRRKVKYLSDVNVSSDSNANKGGPLVSCLQIIAKSHGINISSESLIAGLPLEENCLVPSLFERAAKRAKLASRLVKNNLLELNQALLPVVVLLQNNRACVLLELNQAVRTAKVIYPDLPDAVVEVDLEKLTEVYSGQAIYVRPQQHFDARTTHIQKHERGHWFWSVIGEHRQVYRDVLLAAFIINIFTLVTPLFVMNVYDRVVPNHAIDTLWVLAIGMILMLCADFGLRILRAWFVDLAASRTDIRLSASIMERVLGMKLSHRPVSVGSFAASLQSFESIRGFISSATVLAFVDLPFVLVFAAVILVIGWPLFFPILFGIIASILYAAAAQHKMQALSESSMQASAQRNAVLVESLHGLETLKSQNAEGKMQSQWEKTTLFLSRTNAQMRMLSTSVNSGTAWIQQLVSVVIIIVGVYLIVAGNLTQGALIACYMLSARVMAPISQTAALLMQYHQAATALSSLDAIMQKPVERPLGADWVSRPVLQGAIEFKQVNFHYPTDEREILKNISFKVNAGEHIAILGRNGSGKTTLEKLIAGFYEPTSGAVLLDGIDNHQIDPAELRRNLGYVAQDVHLFFGSLRDNITLGAPQVSDEQLLDAVRLAGLSDFVNSHPAGLEMQIGEQGQLLSGGQRQCVAIARAFLNDPSILLLDEPTGSLDHSTEEEFKRNVKAFAKGKTLIVITHRTSLLELADRIIVMDAGKIVADGPKDQVVEALRQGRIGRAN